MKLRVQQFDDSCLQACVASILEVPAELLPRFTSGDQWLEVWNNGARRAAGVELVHFAPTYLPVGEWIAVVPPKVDTPEGHGHAVVMRKRQLVWDPSDGWARYEEVHPHEVLGVLQIVISDAARLWRARALEEVREAVAV